MYKKVPPEPYRAVFLFKFIDRVVFKVKDEIISKLLAGDANDGLSLFDAVISDRLKQVSFPKPARPVNKERIKANSWLFCDGYRTLEGKFI